MAPTGTLEIVRGDERTKLEWNGVVEDREAARAAFDCEVNEGGRLAVAFTEKGKGKQVRSFTEVEEIEREQGVVSVQVTTGLQGG